MNIIMESAVATVKPSLKLSIPLINEKFFDCEHCKRKVKMNGRNGLHDLCPQCFSSRFTRGKCSIDLDSL